jgi:hypothetical protein
MSEMLISGVDGFAHSSIMEFIPTVIHTEHFDLCKKIIQRDIKYDAKHLPQEVSIIGHLSKFVNPNSVIIDAGGGNGELAYKISQIFPGNLVIMVDRKIPPHVNTGGTFVKIECDFAEKDKLDKYLTSYISADKEVIVICKHLCGSGLDFAMDYFSNSEIKMRHFLLAMCCCSRIDLSHGHFDSTIDKTIVNGTGWFTNKSLKYYLKGKRFVEIIFKYRINKYIALGYDVQVCHYITDDITPYNYLVIGHCT